MSTSLGASGLAPSLGFEDPTLVLFRVNHDVLRNRGNLYAFNFNNPGFYIDPNGEFPWGQLARYWGMWTLPVYKLVDNFKEQLKAAEKDKGTPTFCHAAFGIGALTLTNSDGDSMTIPAIRFGDGNFGFIPGTVDDTVIKFFEEGRVY